MTRDERSEGAMWGLLIGDALGVPYEFHAPSELPKDIDMVPPPGFQRSHASVPPGTYSDDGAQALCLLDSLLICGRLDLNDFGQRLLGWRHQGLWAVDAKVFDVGITTDMGLRRLANGHPPESSGPAEDKACGNGSLMRVLPLALWHRGDDVALVEAAHRSSLPTHGHPVAQTCCAFYCLWVRQELNGASDGWAAGLASLRDVYRDPRFAVHAAALENELLTFTSPAGTGFAVDSLWSVRAALNHSSDFAAVVRRAVAFGNDTDTTAAIAGGIAGLRSGLKGIPQVWLDGMRGADGPRGLIARLVQ